MAIIGNLLAIRDRYFSNNLTVAFDYLLEASTNGSAVHDRIFNHPIGAFERIELEDGMYALEQVFKTKDRSRCFYESHKKYVDFQLNLSGIEQMEWIDISKMHVKEPYNAEVDLLIYKPTQKASKLVMQKNDLAIYFPEDVHLGIAQYGQEESIVHKTVVKVPVSKAQKN